MRASIYLTKAILLLLAWLLVLAAPAHAAPAVLTELPDSSLGKQADFLIEENQALSLDDAQHLFAEGKFKAGEQVVLGFGIGSRPVWLRLEVFNPTDQALLFRLAVGTTWIDHLDLYQIHQQKISATWQTGDAHPSPQGIVPTLGYAFPLSFPPGISEIYLRAETLDPLVLPINLLPIAKVADNERWTHYSYGVLYGFLSALLAYNLMLFVGLRKISYFYYSLYLGSFITLNLAYTGHGYAWWWSDFPHLQRYIIFALMVLYSCFGLLFAVRFLALAEHAPRSLRAVRGFALTGISLLGLSIALDNQYAAGIVAFSYLTLFTLIMATLGLGTLHKSRSSGGYFLAAAFSGLIGAATTSLAVWSVLPFNLLTYHSVEFGLLLESILFALALAYQFRDHEKARLQAEYLARHDPLTGLLNRRAFYELIDSSWSTAVRSDRPLSVIMLDLDLFKEVNDHFGHEAGDLVLVEVAQLLTQCSRTGDLVSRWGGEEFLLVMPETNLQQAFTLAERIRQQIAAKAILTRQGPISISASLGVSERKPQSTLDELIAEADIRLYEAKRGGRNKVSNGHNLALATSAN